MKPIASLIDELQKYSDSDYFDLDTYEAIEKYTIDRSNKSDFESILKFFEKNPNIDYGSPGGLVHFLEDHYCVYYETSLKESVLRAPTSHTLWMFNRITNDKNGSERKKYIEVLKKVTSMNVSDDIKKTAKEFLDFHKE